MAALVTLMLLDRRNVREAFGPLGPVAFLNSMT
jgi:hypothetical protein